MSEKKEDVSIAIMVGIAVAAAVGGALLILNGFGYPFFEVTRGWSFVWGALLLVSGILRTVAFFRMWYRRHFGS